MTEVVTKLVYLEQREKIHAVLFKKKKNLTVAKFKMG